MIVRRRLDADPVPVPGETLGPAECAVRAPSTARGEMAAAVDRDQAAASWPGVIAGDGPASARRGGGIVLVERGPEHGDALGIDGEDLGAVETRGEAIAEGTLHEADDTIRRVRALVIAASLLLAACATRGGMPFTLIQGNHATHVDYTVARANRAL